MQMPDFPSPSPSEALTQLPPTPLLAPAPTPQLQVQPEVDSGMAPFNKSLVNPNNAILKRKLVAIEELDRLTSDTFFNPYDVLYLGQEATEDDMKKMFRSFSMILHPDKCKDTRAQEAFTIVDQAYKLLLDVEKRKVYVRIMREAREKTEYERMKENRRRQKLGLPQLPEETFDTDFKKICKEIFIEIEDRKQHLIRLEHSQRKQKIEEYERRKMLEQFKVLSEQEWEETRDDRVNKWRSFTTTKHTSIGTKQSDKGIRAPPPKMEQRMYIQKKDPEQKRLDEEYQQKV